VLEITLAESERNQDNQELYVMCPLSAMHNKFINRLCYTEILKSALEFYDKFDYVVDVNYGKRIIHFGKKTLKEALIICKNIIESNPFEYRNLQYLIDKLEIKYKN